MPIWNTDAAILKSIPGVLEVHLRPQKNALSHLQYNTLCYKKDGISRHVTATGEVLLHPGELLLLPKNVPYTVSVVEPGSSIAVFFELAEDDTTGTDLLLLPTPNPDKCSEIFERLLQLEAEPDNRYERFAAFYSLLSLLYKQTKEASLPPRIQTAVSYILHHYPSPELCEEELAALCGYSIGYFRRAFTHAVGMTPVRYIISTRMHKAMTLLQSGFYTVTQVAGQVGYRDVYYFSNSFKRTFGLSPTRYLRRLAEK